MKHTASKRFWKCYDTLPLEVQALSKKNFELLKQHPELPSLQFKLLGGAVEEVNARQKRVLFGKLSAALGAGLQGATVAVWGLAFKAETDDMRESPAITLIDAVLEAGGRVKAHDPKAMGVAQGLYGARIAFAHDPYDAVQGADALVIVTEWLLYRSLDLERVRAGMKRALVIDGRNLFEPARMAAQGFDYHGIGRRAP